jgi:hypothetical protein
MSFEGYKKFLAARGIQSAITSSGKFVSTTDDIHHSPYRYMEHGGRSHAPFVGGAIGVRGSIPRLIVININQ